MAKDFRQEVTDAAIKELTSYIRATIDKSQDTGHCPSCGEDVENHPHAISEHAKACVELRADVAQGL